MSLPERSQASSHPAPVRTATGSNGIMAQVTCECGKTVKDENALFQHKRDSPKHRQTVEPGGDDAGSNNPTIASGSVSHVTDRTISAASAMYRLLTTTMPEQPPISSPAPPPHYPLIQFVPAGGDGREQKERARKKKTKKTGGGTGSGMPEWRFTEYGKPYVPGLEDEDWSLCDKDCGWCGHCADGLAF